MAVWQTEDPREVAPDGQQIVILTRESPGSAWPSSLVGTVSNKHSWSIFFYREKDKFIGPDDDWPSRWVWVPGPDQ
tara:strand:- start:60 stop:287 length:228 start_codon:yes stop_codon:yes gene_type:complete